MRIMVLIQRCILITVNYSGVPGFKTRVFVWWSLHIKSIWNTNISLPSW